MLGGRRLDSAPVAWAFPSTLATELQCSAQHSGLFFVLANELSQALFGDLFPVTPLQGSSRVFSFFSGLVLQILGGL